MADSLSPEDQKLQSTQVLTPASHSGRKGTATSVGHGAGSDEDNAAPSPPLLGLAWCIQMIHLARFCLTQGRGHTSAVGSEHSDPTQCAQEPRYFSHRTEEFNHLSGFVPVGEKIGPLYEWVVFHSRFSPSHPQRYPVVYPRYITPATEESGWKPEDSNTSDQLTLRQTTSKGQKVKKSNLSVKYLGGKLPGTCRRSPTTQVRDGASAHHSFLPTQLLGLWTAGKPGMEMHSGLILAWSGNAAGGHTRNTCRCLILRRALAAAIISKFLFTTQAASVMWVRCS